MLTKFPITTDRGEYRVSIENDDWFDHYHAIIFQKRSFLRYFTKFKRLGSYSAKHEVVDNEFVLFAKECVILYEKDCDVELAERAKYDEAIEAFRNWNGDMTTKGESR